MPFGIDYTAPRYAFGKLIINSVYAHSILKCSDDEFAASLKVALPLVGVILCQQLTFDLSICDVQCHSMLEIVTIKHKKQSELAAELHSHLLANFQRTLSLCLRYGWLPSGLATNCVCSQVLVVEHAMNCPRGISHSSS